MTTTATAPLAEAGATRPPTGRLRLLAFAAMAPFASFWLAWAVMWAGGYPFEGDWTFLWHVAEHFVAGDTARLYSLDDPLMPDMYWRYPPFALYLVAPLALLPQETAYTAISASVILTLLVSLRLLAKLASPRGYAVEWSMAIALSHFAVLVLTMGQSSGWLLLGLVVAATLWQRGHPLAAHALLGLFVVKPNWGAFFGLMALARRDWRGAAVMAGVAALVCLTSLPLGADLWRDFVHVSLGNDVILEGYGYFKQITFGSFVESVLGRGPASTAARLVATGVMLAAAAFTWSRVREPVHLLGTTVLLLVAANPYVSNYDGLVLAVPAAVWWSTRERWDPSRWRVVGGMIAACWYWQYIPLVLGPILAIPGDVDSGPPFSIVGPCVAAWLLIQAWEVRSGRLAEPARA